MTRTDRVRIEQSSRLLCMDFEASDGERWSQNTLPTGQYVIFSCFHHLFWHQKLASVSQPSLIRLVDTYGWPPAGTGVAQQICHLLRLSMSCDYLQLTKALVASLSLKLITTSLQPAGADTVQNSIIAPPQRWSGL